MTAHADAAADVARVLVTEALHRAAHLTSPNGKTALAHDVFAGGVTAVAIFAWSCREPGTSFEDVADMIREAALGMMPQVAGHANQQQGQA